MLEKLEQELTVESEEVTEDVEEASSSVSDNTPVTRRTQQVKVLSDDEKLDLSVRVELFKCQKHDLVFNTRDELENHMKKKHKQKQKFECDICKQRFTTRAMVNNHVKESHTDIDTDRPYVCDVPTCGKTFKSKRGKQGHMESHVDNGKYKCEKCDKTFGTMQTLNNHRATHSDEKPFKCHYCEATFKRPNEIPRHMAKCQDAKAARARAVKVEPLVKSESVDCVLCDQVFTTHDELNRHLLSQHKSESKVKCEQCGKEFKTKSQLTAHKLVHVRAEKKKRGDKVSG